MLFVDGYKCWLNDIPIEIIRRQFDLTNFNHTYILNKCLLNNLIKIKQSTLL